MIGPHQASVAAYHTALQKSFDVDHCPKKMTQTERTTQELEFISLKHQVQKGR